MDLDYLRNEKTKDQLQTWIRNALNFSQYKIMQVFEKNLDLNGLRNPICVFGLSKQKEGSTDSSLKTGGNVTC